MSLEFIENILFLAQSNISTWQMRTCTSKLYIFSININKNYVIYSNIVRSTFLNHFHWRTYRRFLNEVRVPIGKVSIVTCITLSTVLKWILYIFLTMDLVAWFLHFIQFICFLNEKKNFLFFDGCLCTSHIFCTRVIVFYLNNPRLSFFINIRYICIIIYSKQ